MPDIESAERHQDAVLWAKSDDDRYGAPKVSAGTALRVRWEEKKSEMLDAQGETVAIDAQVVVDRDVTVGGIMWLGKLSSLGGASPTSNIYQVAAFDKVPDIDGIYFRRTVGLKRFGDNMPTIV